MPDHQPVVFEKQNLSVPWELTRHHVSHITLEWETCLWNFGCPNSTVNYKAIFMVDWRLLYTKILQFLQSHSSSNLRKEIKKGKVYKNSLQLWAAVYWKENKESSRVCDLTWFVTTMGIRESSASDLHIRRWIKHLAKR